MTLRLNVFAFGIVEILEICFPVDKDYCNSKFTVTF